MKRILVIVLLLCSQAFAGNWYVRKGAAGLGNGTDWTNAWPDFNNIAFASVACGDTIWIAGNNGGASYTGAMSGFKSCASNTVVNIIRATTADAVPVAAAGWLATFDSQVTILNVSFTMSGNWWTFDGRTGDAQSNIPYGIQFNNTTDGWNGVINNNVSGTITGITLSHIEVHGPLCAATSGVGSCGSTNDALKIDRGGTTGLTVDHCWFHRFAEVIHGPTVAASLFTLQYSYIGEDVFVTTAEHEDLLYTADPCGQMVFNANTWYASGNDGIFMDFNGCNNGFVFTNNVFMGWGGWSIALGKTGTCGPYTIVGNTFANNSLGSDGTGNEFTFGFLNDSGCAINAASVLTNNITYNMTIGDFTNAEATFNAGTKTNGFNFACGTGCFQYTIAAPIQSFNGFTNFTAAGTPYYSSVVQSDFHLTAAGKTLFQGKATNLTAQCGAHPTFCTDRAGNTRPTSGAWDLGAFQTPTLVNQCVVGNEGNTASITTPSCVNTAGNFLIVTTTAVRPASTLTITDTVGDTFVNANPSVFPFHDTIQDGDVYIWYVPSAKGGSPNTFQIVPASGSSALEIHVSEWTGMGGWLPDKTAVANASTGGSAFSSGSATTSANGELIFGYTFPLGNSSPGVGFTQISLVNGDIDEYLIQPTAGSTAATFTSTNNGTWLATMQTFMASAATVQVATPVLSPVAGTYATAQSVTITSSTATATICYTVDGTVPTANGAGTCTHGTTLANGGVVTVSTSETVQSLGTLSGDADSAVASATYTIGIPVASLAPASLSFAGINISNTSTSQTLTLQNTGTAVMSITSISLTGANSGDFFQSNNCPVGSNLGNGSICTITVTFTPLAVGARSASVSVVDGAAGSPHSSTLAGTGVQPLISGQMNPGARLSGRAVLK